MLKTLFPRTSSALRVSYCLFFSACLLSALALNFLVFHDGGHPLPPGKTLAQQPPPIQASGHATLLEHSNLQSNPPGRPDPLASWPFVYEL